MSSFAIGLCRVRAPQESHLCTGLYSSYIKKSQLIFLPTLWSNVFNIWTKVPLTNTYSSFKTNYLCSVIYFQFTPELWSQADRISLSTSISCHSHCVTLRKSLYLLPKLHFHRCTIISNMQNSLWRLAETQLTYPVIAWFPICLFLLPSMTESSWKLLEQK